MEKAMLARPRLLSWFLVALGATAWVACGGKSLSVPGGSGGSATGGITSSATIPSSGGTGSSATGGTTSTATTAASGGTTGPSFGGASGGTTGTGSGGAAGGSATVPSGGTTGSGGSSTGAVAPVMGGPCSVQGEQSACATAGPNPCVSCMGSWLYCWNGTWHETHCDPPALDAGRNVPLDQAPDVADAKDVPPDRAPPIDTASIESSVDGDGILRGYIVFATELMAFEPCGSTTLIWANLQGWEKGQELLPALGPYCVITDAGQAPCPGTYYVEITGTISPEGRYGHLNKFSQQLSIGAYLAASLTGPPDCPFLPPVYPN